MVGSVDSDAPPGTSHLLGKPRSVDARWMISKRVWEPLLEV